MENQDPVPTLNPMDFSSNGESHFTVDSIIGKSPGWILRSGMTVLFIVVMIGIALTFIIRYPDKISSSGVITTTDPFKPISSRIAGLVDTVFVVNNEKVKKNSPVVYIQNSASREDVEKISIAIDSLEKDINGSGFAFKFSTEDLSLGPMQSTFASLNQQLKEYVHYLKRTDFISKLQAIDREIEAIVYLNKILEQEAHLTEQEVNLSEKDLERNLTLYDNGIISEREIEKSQLGHLEIRKSFLIKGISMTQNQIRIASLEQQKMDIQAARTEQILLYQSRISETILNFQNLYINWYQQFFVTAPAEGMIQLSTHIVAGQSVSQGESIGFVIPAGPPSNKPFKGSNDKYAQIWVTSAGVGKIDQGNRALIHVEAYPYKEFGTIESRVEYIYPISVLRQGQRFYEIHLPLDTILMTDYGKFLKYSPEMPIQASIITKERSLFNRIFDQFINLLNQHV